MARDSQVLLRWPLDGRSSLASRFLDSFCLRIRLGTYRLLYFDAAGSTLAVILARARSRPIRGDSCPDVVDCLHRPGRYSIESLPWEEGADKGTFPELGRHTAPTDCKAEVLCRMPDY